MRKTSKFTHGLGERMRYLRVRDSLSQEELAGKLDISRQSISGYERERLFPSIRIVEKMCDLYSTNPWWLLYGVGGPFSGPEDVTQQENVTHLSAPGERLTTAQQALIEYIKGDKEAAQQLARLLWDKALKQ